MTVRPLCGASPRPADYRSERSRLIHEPLVVWVAVHEPAWPPRPGGRPSAAAIGDAHLRGAGTDRGGAVRAIYESLKEGCG